MSLRESGLQPVDGTDTRKLAKHSDIIHAKIGVTFHPERARDFVRAMHRTMVIHGIDCFVTGSYIKRFGVRQGNSEVAFKAPTHQFPSFLNDTAREGHTSTLDSARNFGPSGPGMRHERPLHEGPAPLSPPHHYASSRSLPEQGRSNPGIRHERPLHEGPAPLSPPHHYASSRSLPEQGRSNLSRPVLGRELPAPYTTYSHTAGFPAQYSPIQYADGKSAQHQTPAPAAGNRAQLRSYPSPNALGELATLSHDREGHIDHSNPSPREDAHTDTYSDIYGPDPEEAINTESKYEQDTDSIGHATTANVMGAADIHLLDQINELKDMICKMRAHHKEEINNLRQQLVAPSQSAVFPSQQTQSFDLRPQITLSELHIAPSHEHTRREIAGLIQGSSTAYFILASTGEPEPYEYHRARITFWEVATRALGSYKYLASSIVAGDFFELVHELLQADKPSASLQKITIEAEVTSFKKHPQMSWPQFRVDFLELMSRYRTFFPERDNDSELKLRLSISARHDSRYTRRIDELMSNRDYNHYPFGDYLNALQVFANGIGDKAPYNPRARHSHAHHNARGEASLVVVPQSDAESKPRTRNQHQHQRGKQRKSPPGHIMEKIQNRIKLPHLCTEWARSQGNQCNYEQKFGFCPFMHEWPDRPAPSQPAECMEAHSVPSAQTYAATMKEGQCWFYFSGKKCSKHAEGTCQFAHNGPVTQRLRQQPPAQSLQKQQTPVQSPIKTQASATQSARPVRPPMKTPQAFLIETASKYEVPEAHDTPLGEVHVLYNSLFYVLYTYNVLYNVSNLSVILWCIYTIIMVYILDHTPIISCETVYFHKSVYDVLYTLEIWYI